MGHLFSLRSVRVTGKGEKKGCDNYQQAIRGHQRNSAPGSVPSLKTSG